MMLLDTSVDVDTLFPGATDEDRQQLADEVLDLFLERQADERKQERQAGALAAFHARYGRAPGA